MLYIIKKDCVLSEYESERLSKTYAEEIERGVLVLGKGEELQAASKGEVLYKELD